MVSLPYLLHKSLPDPDVCMVLFQTTTASLSRPLCAHVCGQAVRHFCFPNVNKAVAAQQTCSNTTV